jgi:glutathione S-transferase
MDARIITTLEERIAALKDENSKLEFGSGNSVEVAYWKIRGLGAPLRMMCAYAGAKFTPTAYEVTGESPNWDRSAWFDVKPELKAKNALMNLPYVIDGDNIVTQSNACLEYLGRKFGLLGSNEGEESKTQQCLSQVMDLRNSAVGCFYSGSDAAKHIDSVKVHYDKFEGWLKDNGTDYVAGPSPTAADFHLWEMLDQHEAFCIKKELPLLLHSDDTPYTKLKQYYTRFAALPQLQSYFAGDLHKFPMNNKMADFGGEYFEYSTSK